MEKQIKDWNNKTEDEQTILCMTHLINKNITLEKEIKNLKKKLLQMTRDCNDQAFKHYKCKKEIKQLKDENLKNLHFAEFVSDKIHYNPESDNIIGIAELYIEYKEWYKDNHGTTEGQARLKELKKYFDIKFGEHWDKGKPYTSVGYKGITLVNTDELLLSNGDFGSDDNLELL